MRWLVALLFLAGCAPAQAAGAHRTLVPLFILDRGVLNFAVRPPNSQDPHFRLVQSMLLRDTAAHTISFRWTAPDGSLYASETDQATYQGSLTAYTTVASSLIQAPAVGEWVVSTVIDGGEWSRFAVLYDGKATARRIVP